VGYIFDTKVYLGKHCQVAVDDMTATHNTFQYQLIHELVHTDQDVYAASICWDAEGR
jgi:hypothetical protein